MELTCNRLCRPFDFAGMHLALKVDLSSSDYDMDGEVCEERTTLAVYHVNARNGALHVFRGDVLIHIATSGRMSEVLDVMIRDFTRTKQAPTICRG